MKPQSNHLSERKGIGRTEEGYKYFYYRKYPNLVCTQVEIISDPNYLVRILFERKSLKHLI